MSKYTINLDNLKQHVLLECIIHGSAVATKYKYKDFYTFNGTPENWREQFLQDVHESHRQDYKGEIFYISKHYEVESAITRISYIFHGDHVYSFDSYFADCPIFEKILSIY